LGVWRVESCWKTKTKTNRILCVCVCRSARDCGATERRCRSFGRNRRVLLPGPRRTDASTLMAQKRTQGESSQKKYLMLFCFPPLLLGYYSLDSGPPLSRTQLPWVGTDERREIVVDLSRLFLSGWLYM
jgi:hypothetical protein